MGANCTWSPATSRIRIVIRGFETTCCRVFVRNSVNPPVPIAEMRTHVEAFLTEDSGPWKFWGYYCAYDWFLFCRLWGGMLRMPVRMPKLCFDLKQVGEAMFPGISLKSVVVPEVPEHNALADARWNARLHAWLIARSAP
jgi:hypothetical protein